MTPSGVRTLAGGRGDGDLDTIRFRGPLVAIGSFRAAPHDPRFHEAGRIDTHLFVFPRTAVRIRHLGEEAFVADPAVVTYYNRGQPYRREAISAEGDRCEWFAPAPEIVVEAVCRYEPRAAERPERPFRFGRGASDSRLYLAQRRLVLELAADPTPEPLRVEEACVDLLYAVLASAYGSAAARRPPTPADDRRGRELADRAETVLAERFRERLGLGPLAALLGVSPGHLCRVFRRVVGASLHGYREQLRLRAALEEIESDRDLTDLALELGYSSHSHFTAAFRSCFGETPSAYRRSLAGAGSARRAARGRARLSPVRAVRRR